MSNSKIVQIERFSFNKSIMIGEGKFGKVYRGNDSKTNQPVCIKVFQKKQEFGENVLETVNQKELDLTKKMINEQHKNLVKIIDIFDEINQEEAYMIMELCDKSLTEHAKQNKLNREEIIDFIYQVTNGYHRLEVGNVVHRDMKPDNILIKQNEEKVIYKIADFGFGKILDQATHETKTKYIGTPYYWAPEIINSSKVYTSKCDIFSFGIIIFELLVGNQTFKSLQNREKLKVQNFEDIFCEELKGVDTWLKKLLSNMIIYDWTKRMGWKELKVIIDLNMNDKYKGILGRMGEDDLFFGHYSQNEKNKITVKIFESDKGNEKEIQFSEPYSPADSINVIKINEVIHCQNSFIYTIMEGCDCNLHQLMGKFEFNSDDIYNLIEQIVNGWSALSQSKQKTYSITVQNILIQFNKNEKKYKITNYEYFSIKKRANHQLIVQPIATISQLAWILYQLILNQNVTYHEFQQAMKNQELVNTTLKNLNQNVKNLVEPLMKTEQNIQSNWESLKKQINDAKYKPQTTEKVGQIQFQQQSSSVQPQFSNPSIANRYQTPQEQPKQTSQISNQVPPTFTKFQSFKVLPQATPQQTQVFQPNQNSNLPHSAPHIQINNASQMFNPVSQSQVINNHNIGNINSQPAQSLNFQLPLQPFQQQQQQVQPQGFQPQPPSQVQPRFQAMQGPAQQAFQPQLFSNNRGQFNPPQQNKK